MYITLIAISFLASVAMTLFLRRLDKPRAQAAQLRRVSTAQGEQLEKLTADSIRQIRDASIEFEMTHKQSRQLQNDLNDSLHVYEERLQQLQQDYSLVDQISGDLAGLAGQAGQVTNQVAQLDRGLERLALAERDITDLDRGIQLLKTRLEKQGSEASQTLGSIVETLIQETEDRSQKLTENIRSSYQILQDDFQKLESGLREHSDASETLSQRISNMGSRMEDRWQQESNRIEEHAVLLKSDLDERVAGLEKGLGAIRKSAVEAVQSEISSMRQDVENMGLDVIAKRDETLHETRRMAEEMQSRMQEFQESYLNAESRLLRDIRSHEEELSGRLDSFASKQQAARTADHEAVRNEWDMLRGEMQNLKEEKTNQLTAQVDTSMQQARESLLHIRIAEEESLKAMQEDLGQLKENLVYLGQELKAGLRNEAEETGQNFRSLRTASIAEIQKATAELEAKQNDFTQNIDKLQKDLQNNEVRFQKQIVASQNEVEEHSIDIQAGFEKLEENIQQLDQELMSHLRQEADNLDLIMQQKMQTFEVELNQISKKIEDQVGEFTMERQQSERLLENVNLAAVDARVSMQDELEKMGRQFHGELNRLLQRYQAGLQERKDELLLLAENSEHNIETKARTLLDGICLETETRRQDLETRLAGEVSLQLSALQESGQNLLQESKRDLKKMKDESYLEILTASTEMQAEMAATRHSHVQDITDRQMAQMEELAASAQELDRMKESTLRLMEGRQTDLRTELTAIHNEAHSELQDLQDAASSEWQRIRAEASDQWQSIHTQASDEWQNLKENASGEWQTIHTQASTEWQNLKENASGEWQTIQSQSSMQWHKIKSEASADYQELQENLSGSLQAAHIAQERLLAEIHQESTQLSELREDLTLIEKSSEYVKELSQTMEVLEERLQLTRNENANLDELMTGIENLRLARKEMESEARLLASQRHRLTEAEDHFQSIEKRMTDLGEQFQSIGEAEELARTIEKRVGEFQTFKDSFETYFSELGDRRKFVEKAVAYIDNARERADQASSQADKLLDELERSEIRQQNLGDSLKEIEGRAALLNKMDNDFQQVEARFEQMDGLLVDLSEKQKQIGSMSRRIHDMQSGGGELRTELESLLSEADEKMDRLSAFYQTIDLLLDNLSQMDPEAEQIALTETTGKRRGSKKNIPDHKVNGILSLHLNHKWDVELIADRMKLDPAIVRTVIASHNK